MEWPFGEEKINKLEIATGDTQMRPFESIKKPENSPIWKEITPDPEIISAETAIQKLEKDGHVISYYAKPFLFDINYKKELKERYDMALIMVKQLFKDKSDHTYKEIKEEADKQGLKLIPAKLVPSIRKNYSKDVGLVVIAIEPISDAYDDQRLFFCNESGGESFLGVDSGLDDHYWRSWHQFFFIRK